MNIFNIIDCFEKENHKVGLKHIKELEVKRYLI